MAHLEPLPEDLHPQLAGSFEVFRRILGFVPNSLLTMQRRPKVVEAFGVLTGAVMDPEGEVDLGFKRLVAHWCSRAAQCQYCMAHSLIAARIHGISADKVAAINDYPTSPLYSPAERAALAFAEAAGRVPNAVDAATFDRMRAHWSEGQIVEILAVVALYGFLNRWNDTMATTLEAPACAIGDAVLVDAGWTGGKHRDA
jgi:uncharacterized peroxidase-related enzyme